MESVNYKSIQILENSSSEAFKYLKTQLPENLCLKYFKCESL